MAIRFEKRRFAEWFLSMTGLYYGLTVIWKLMGYDLELFGLFDVFVLLAIFLIALLVNLETVTEFPRNTR